MDEFTHHGNGLCIQKADHAEAVAGLVLAAQALTDAMETCHQCQGTVFIEEQPVHCEDCSSVCESHEGAECPTIYLLHLMLKKALAAHKP